MDVLALLDSGSAELVDRPVYGLTNPALMPLAGEIQVVRRLACDARILPVLLNGPGIPVDVGRARRLFFGAARPAVVIRDGGCAFPGCDRSPRWCDVHHVVAWTDGGSTDRDNGVALCGHHHRLVHRDGWVVAMGADQRPDFIPPPHVDPLQTPRRNRYHART